MTTPILNGTISAKYDLPTGNVTLPAADLLALWKLAGMVPNNFLTDDESEHALELHDEIRSVLRSQADWCEDCQRVQNQPPPRTMRACEDCEDGMREDAA